MAEVLLPVGRGDLEAERGRVTLGPVPEVQNYHLTSAVAAGLGSSSVNGSTWAGMYGT